MRGFLIMVMAVVTYMSAMLMSIFIETHWPTLVQTALAYTGLVLQVTALHIASKDQQP